MATSFLKRPKVRGLADESVVKTLSVR